VRALLFLVAAAFAMETWAQNEPQEAQAPVERVTKVPSAAAGGSAVTTEDPEAAQRLFRELDKNGDGYLSGDELWSPPGQQANWAAIDRNRDGRISPDEFTVLRR